MLLKVCLLLASAACLQAAPSKPDLSTSEGRHLPAYAPPAQHGSATVTSYNRRGPALSKPDHYSAPKYQPVQYDTKPAQYDIKPAQYDIKPAQYDIKPAQYDIKPAQYDIKPAQYDVKPAEYGHASQYAKPSIYGSSYPQSSIRSPVYSPEPQPHGYSSQALDYPAYGGYGPQTNAYSEQSRHLSHDPSYDPAKDPVSQYAKYVPNREYGSKGHSNGNELSIYGYRK